MFSSSVALTSAAALSFFAPLASGSQGTPAGPGSATNDLQEALPPIHWRSGAVQLARRPTAEARGALADLVARSPRAGQSHFLAQFDRPLSPGERDTVRRAGLDLQTYVGGNAWIVAARDGGLDTGALAAIPLAHARTLETAWKLHPVLERDEVPTWSVVEEKAAEAPVVGVYVQFHPDVSLAGEGFELVSAHGATVRATVQSIHTLVVELPLDEVKPLAAEDGVLYVEPPLPRMDGVMVNDNNRARVGANLAHSAPYNLDGSGVSVMVYDAGTTRSTHQDFSGRATVRDSSGMNFHATHVAATVGGDGTASSGTFMGMAPAVTIESYGFEWDGSDIFLYTNPGDFEADYTEAITTYGVDLANNSIGSNTESNGWPCAIQGDYGLMSSLIDAMVRGSGGAPLPIVWAAGNERQGSSCDIEGFGDYYSCAPPATAKNHISVGALNSNDDSVTSFTSWGPTDDGRLKPDISGPGCQSSDDFGVTSATSSGDTAYSTLCGTSMASPTVAGITALMLEDYRAQYGGADPLGSTFKTLLAHTATDVGNAGPDYQTGYGSVRAVDAIEHLRSGNFLEDSVDQGEVALYTVSVAGGEVLKVTLAWDDYQAAPLTGSALVNDLDLYAYSPSGTEAFPWTLDPLDPSAPAVQTTHDSLNNIEQVHVEFAEAGVWQIEVHGTNVPQGPQSFSLAASPLLLSCAEGGIASLDGSAYACGATVGGLVIDCGLNTDDNAIESVNVVISSTSEPTGEVVTLTESAAETSAFSGSVPTSTVDAPGVLLVAEGDTIELTYMDADDGTGNTATVVASAAVDCTAPTLTQLSVSEIETFSAVVDLTADEPIGGTIRYGENCGALNQTRGLGGLDTNHSVLLTGLDDNTTYFFQVEYHDAAGNAVLDDNSGACFSFTTPDVPDYFTEQFSGHDLAMTTVLYRPVPTFEGYRGCSQPMQLFPTPPGGGTALPMSDDDSELVVLSGGKTVWLYGVEYDRFWVGSNGYITFGASDSDYSESIGEHFDTPRISANFDDYNPSAGGTVSWKQLSNRVVVTWQNVPEYNTSNQNSFQVAMFFDGKIQVSYRNLASSDGIAGLSAGTGVPSGFIESDLSGYECSKKEADIVRR